MTAPTNTGERGVERREYSRSDVALREYVEAIFDEHQRALAVAEQEREKAAAGLREYFQSIVDGDRRALGVAEQEREKTAKALRAAMERAISEGDHNLREHIEQQVQQIRAALTSAELLEVHRIDALRREMVLIFEASEEAIDKADKATEKRFESVNEFRAQLADMVARFMLREVADTQLKEMSKKIGDLETRLNLQTGQATGTRDAKAGIASNAQIALGVLGLLVAVLSIAVVVILANSGQG